MYTTCFTVRNSSFSSTDYIYVFSVILSKNIIYILANCSHLKAESILNNL
jgi:hypothetical protein